MATDWIAKLKESQQALVLTDQPEPQPSSSAMPEEISEVEKRLAEYDPDLEAGPVQLVEVAIITLGGITSVWAAEEWEAFRTRVQEHNTQARERWRKKA